MRRLAIVTVCLLLLATAVFLAYPAYVAKTWGQRLRTAAQGCDRMLIKTGGSRSSPEDADAVRFESSNTHLIAQALQTFEAQSHLGTVCHCRGGPTVLFYRGTEMLAAVTMHHRLTLRWYGHTDIKPTEKSMASLLAFFKEHGVKDEDIQR
jgi:hypothetical protein